MLATPFETLDLTAVMSRVRQEHQLDDDTAICAEQLYRQFLQLHKKYPETSLVPSHLIDAVWHQHLLDSKQYMADCQALFGHYLHHNPNIQGDGHPFWERTKQLYRDEFGIAPDCLGAAGDCHKCIT